MYAFHTREQKKKKRKLFISPPTMNTLQICLMTECTFFLFTLFDSYINILRQDAYDTTIYVSRVSRSLFIFSLYHILYVPEKERDREKKDVSHYVVQRVFNDLPRSVAHIIVTIKRNAAPQLRRPFILPVAPLRPSGRTYITALSDTGIL